MNFDIYERIYSSHWFLSGYSGIGIVRDFPKMGGGKFMKNAMYIMEKDMCRYIFEKEQFEKAADYTSDKLINNEKWRKKIYRRIERFTKLYFNGAEKLRKMDLSNLTDERIAKIVDKLVPLQHNHQVLGILANGVVLDGRNHLSSKIRQEIRKHMGNPNDFDKQWSFLTAAIKMSLRQKKDYEIALLAKSYAGLGKNKTEKKLRSIWQKYSWLDYNNMGEPASFKSYIEELGEARKNNKNLNLPKNLEKTKRMQEDFMKKYRFNFMRASGVAKVVVRSLTPRGVLGFFASMLAPTGHVGLPNKIPSS